MEDADVTIEIPSAYERAAVVQVALVDIDAHDMKIFRSDQVMIFLDHDPVADSHIQDPGVMREIMKAISVAVIGNVINYQLV
jgi:hypothetical protein